ncbi:uncharacterized protein LOC118439386 [Folsomia candida]|uniref:Uncharacterized protein n=1 Tax=Folsomia candida TaxID=158441 RepID=A0A226ENX5_FOLCA|nr:uncharacterized protein LOC110844533 [Folsomia candida]XP_035705344.1 uncharacterized protein LOC118434889 [Folsomia candida]XP_035716535.1 uncharacterized protein LOC118439386 [Folsomia candida]OXA40133.1 hypothetical protein Fcan01_24997 [Folsomia candida]OXA59199.1 hypothetical protein Fcan01_05347 [Folsomia candida]
MSHVVVHWEKEKSYSCVKLKKVIKGDCGVDDLLDKSFDVQWGGDKEKGKIIGIGSRKDMKILEGEKAQEAADMSFYEHNGEEGVEEGPPPEGHSQLDGGTEIFEAEVRNSDEGNFSASLVLAPGSGSREVEVNHGRHDADVIQLQERLIEKDKEIAMLQAENLSLRTTVKQLKRLIKKTGVSNEESQDRVELAHGISLDKSLVELTQISYSSRPSLFFRKLLFEGGLFQLEEIAGSSMTGKSSPLFRHLTRPALDPVRFGVLKDFTIKSCGIKTNTLEMVEFEQKLRNIPGDARKRLAAVNNS